MFNNNNLIERAAVPRLSRFLHNKSRASTLLGLFFDLTFKYQLDVIAECAVVAVCELLQLSFELRVDADVDAV